MKYSIFLIIWQGLLITHFDHDHGSIESVNYCISHNIKKDPVEVKYINVFLHNNPPISNDSENLDKNPFSICYIWY